MHGVPEYGYALLKELGAASTCSATWTSECLRSNLRDRTDFRRYEAVPGAVSGRRLTYADD